MPEVLVVLDSDVPVKRRARERAEQHSGDGISRAVRTRAFVQSSDASLLADVPAARHALQIHRYSFRIHALVHNDRQSPLRDARAV